MLSKNKKEAYIILWDSSSKFFDEIIEKISENVNIEEQVFTNITNYYDFIVDIYSFNNQRNLGIYKASKMCNKTKYNIYILKVSFFSLNYSLIKNLKTEIRNQFKDKIEGYFHDNIIHTSDSEEEFKHLNKIIFRINKY